jgi:hypothetical protein
MQQAMATPARLLLLACLFLSLIAWVHDDESHGILFKHSVTKEKEPWTNKTFLNDPNNFRFALVSNRTGGVRHGGFPRAVKKLNELQTEFVISVGTLTKGGARLTGERVVREDMNEKLMM